jgi:uncharacterized membrane protein YcjF (UPF0283 family)
LIVANYNFASFLWDVLVIFAFIIWFWLLIVVFGDIFRRRDISGWGKTAWIILVIVLPYFGVFIYLIAEHSGMADRNMQQQQAQQVATDQYIRSVSGSGGAASEIETAKNLLDSGAITQAEYDAIKAKALGGS